MLYDEELMIVDVVDLFKANLNTKILAINAEKNDAIVLEEIPHDKYVFETLGESMLNYTGFFLMYGITDTPLKEASTANLLEDVMFTFQICTFDRGEAERSNTLWQLLRYRRALRSVIIDYPDVFRGYAKALISGLKPSAFEFNRNAVLTIGIDIKALVSAN